MFAVKKMSPLGPLLRVLFQKAAQHPQFQQEMQKAATVAKKHGADAVAAAKKHTAGLQKSMAGLVGNAKGGANAGSASANASSAGASSAHHKAYDSNTSSSTSSSTGGAGGAGGEGAKQKPAWDSQAKAKAFFGRMAAKGKEAFSKFNPARDFMLVIMCLQLFQGLWHMLTAKPQVNPHAKAIEHKHKKEQDKEAKEKERQLEIQRALQQKNKEQAGSWMSVAGLSAAVAGSSQAARHPEDSHHPASTPDDVQKFDFDNQMTFTREAEETHVSPTSMKGAAKKSRYDTTDEVNHERKQQHDQRMASRHADQRTLSQGSHEADSSTSANFSSSPLGHVDDRSSDLGQGINQFRTGAGSEGFDGEVLMTSTTNFTFGQGFDDNGKPLPTSYDPLGRAHERQHQQAARGSWFWGARKDDICETKVHDDKGTTAGTTGSYYDPLRRY